MIGRRGYRIAERPCAFRRPQPGTPRRSGAPQHAGAPQQAGAPRQPGVARHSASRDPPPDTTSPQGRRSVDGEELGRPPSAAASSPGKGAGPAEAPASPDRTKLTKLRPKPDNGKESRYDYTHYIGPCSMQEARQAP
jgi:hypothetical protein